MSPKLWSYPVVVSQVVVTLDLWESHPQTSSSMIFQPSQTYPNSHSFQSQDMMFVNCHELPRMCCGLFSLPLAVFQDATRKRLVAQVPSQGEQAKQQDDWMKLGGENHDQHPNAIIPQPWSHDHHGPWLSKRRDFHSPCGFQVYQMFIMWCPTLLHSRCQEIIQTMRMTL